MKHNVCSLILAAGILLLFCFAPLAKEVEKDSKKKKPAKKTETVINTPPEAKDTHIDKTSEAASIPKPQKTSLVKDSFDKLLLEHENTVIMDTIKLNWYVFPGGISSGTGSDIRMSSVSGQDFIGTYTSPQYHLSLGFFQNFPSASCCIGYRGNVREESVDDGSPYSLNVADLVRLAAFMLAGDPPPPCLAEADIDGSGQIDISDVIHLVDFMFRDGPLPALCP